MIAFGSSLSFLRPQHVMGFHLALLMKVWLTCSQRTQRERKKELVLKKTSPPNKRYMRTNYFMLSTAQ